MSDLVSSNAVVAVNEEPQFIFSAENVSVYVPDEDLICCSKSLLQSCSYYLNLGKAQNSSFTAFRGVYASLKSGETCLIRGPSGSGKTTLLRSFCGRLNQCAQLNTEKSRIYLNGIKLSKNDERLRFFSSFVSESDSEHCPFLTVYETLYFAAQCTAPKHEASTDNLGEIIHSRVIDMLEILGLSTVSDTVVGDENLRGISGGQKRRLTVGEMLINKNTRLLCLDNVTDGLASTDALRLIQNIKSICKQEGKMAFITLSQPSDDVIHLFDKILVLSHDREMDYFGSILDERKTQQILDVQANDYESIDLQSNDLASMEHSFKSSIHQFIYSPEYKQIMSEINQTIGSEILTRNLQEYETRQKSIRTSYWYQFQIIAKRRYKLITRNSVTYCRPIICMFFGFLIGALYSELNNDIFGMLGRQGYIYLTCYVSLILSATLTMPVMFRERQIFFKHSSANFYLPLLYYLVNIFLDSPLCIIDSAILSSITYAWVDMSPGADHYIIFLSFLVALGFFGHAFARFLSSLLSTQMVTITVCGVCFYLWSTVAGYLPRYEDINENIRWFSWLSPVSYAFEALTINECDDLHFYLFSYTDSKTGVIVDVGSLTGNDWIDLMTLPRLPWSNEQVLYFDFVMICIFALVTDIMGIFLMKYSREWYYYPIRRRQVRLAKNIDSTKTEHHLENHSELQGNNIIPLTLSAVDLTYTISTNTSILQKIAFETNTENEITLIRSITAQFTSGSMTALMGPSGAGKSTLLDIIAGYKTKGTTVGSILVNGTPSRTSTWRKISGYAEQNDDLFNPYLTVLETLQFTAYCRLPSHVNKTNIVNIIIKLMGLDRYTNMLVGRGKVKEGLPKHIRKRLTIANELVTLPKILFLDEPTTGLDIIEAANIIQEIRKTTDRLQLVTIASIHQPSTKIFELFDNLLLLTKTGRLAYVGPIGKDSSLAIDYFKSLCSQLVPSYNNPAEFILEVLNEKNDYEVVTTFQNSKINQDLQAKIEFERFKSETDNISPAAQVANNENTSTFKFFLLIKRHLLCNWRNPGYSYLQTIVLTFMMLYLGALFYQLETDVIGAINMISCINFVGYVLAIPMTAGCTPLIEDRAVMFRETKSGNYARYQYILAKQIADVPFYLVNAIFMTISVYYLVGFRSGVGYFFYFLLIMLFSNWITSVIGHFYALASPNEEAAYGLVGLTVTVAVFFGGFIIIAPLMPSSLEWAYWSDPFRYLIQGLCTNELSGQYYSIPIPTDDDYNSTYFHYMSVFDDDNTVFNENNMTSFINYSPRSLQDSVTMNFDHSSITSLTKCLVNENCQNDILSNKIYCNVVSFEDIQFCQENIHEFIDISKNDLDTKSDCLAWNEESYRLLSSSTLESSSFSNSSRFEESNNLQCLMESLKAKNMLKNLGTTFVFQNSNILQDIELKIPGDFLLFVFDWAEFDDGEFSAPYKWYYCFTSLVIMTAGVEVGKVVAIYLFNWTKR